MAKKRGWRYLKRRLVEEKNAGDSVAKYIIIFWVIFWACTSFSYWREINAFMPFIAKSD